MGQVQVLGSLTAPVAASPVEEGAFAKIYQQIHLLTKSSGTASAEEVSVMVAKDPNSSRSWMLIDSLPNRAWYVGDRGHLGAATYDTQGLAVEGAKILIGKHLVQGAWLRHSRSPFLKPSNEISFDEVRRRTTEYFASAGADRDRAIRRLEFFRSADPKDVRTQSIDRDSIDAALDFIRTAIWSLPPMATVNSEGMAVVELEDKRGQFYGDITFSKIDGRTFIECFCQIGSEPSVYFSGHLSDGSVAKSLKNHLRLKF